MSQAQANEIKALLLQLKDQLLTTLNDHAGAAETVELDQAMVGRLSRMDAMQHQEMAKAQKRRAEERLVQVENRLRQFEDGETDSTSCSDCLEPIPWARLRALPDADLCVSFLNERANA